MASDVRLLFSILHGYARPLSSRSSWDIASQSHRFCLSFAIGTRKFSATARKRERRPVDNLPDSVAPVYQESRGSDLLSLKWPSPPQNILLVKKYCTPITTDALKEFAKHVKTAYPSTNIVLEPQVASEIHSELPFPVHSESSNGIASVKAIDKVDLVTTFGGDGTILHAAGLFATSDVVPPFLSFSMGTLGFLGEWKFIEHKRAFREVYMSGVGVGDRRDVLGSSKPSGGHERCNPNGLTGWSSIRGKSMGTNRGVKVLARNRLKVGVFDADGQRLSSTRDSSSGNQDIYAMNEVNIHRGKDPHLAIVEVYVGGRFLTEAVADGMIISSPTGSTAYSLSSGGSIIHPLVSSLLLTPICPRSLSFRPLVLPASTSISLKLSEKNRGREVEVSIDGVRRREGIGVGTELRVCGEEVGRIDGIWKGGIPCILRRSSTGAEGDDGWVGGLNGLLKFNYPFGEES